MSNEHDLSRYSQTGHIVDLSVDKATELKNQVFFFSIRGIWRAIYRFVVPTMPGLLL